MIHKYDILCPSCRTKLNDGTKLTLKTKRESGEEGLIHLSTTIGNYSYTHEPAVIFDIGELVTFSCPKCYENLNSKDFENYALLKMKVDENIEFEILFSRKAGIQKTYLVTEDGIETYSGT